MKIPVVGFDPSLTHWGIAEAMLDLTTGYLDSPSLSVIVPSKLTGKQVRQNSTDLYVGEQLAKAVLAAAHRAKVCFAEVPVGSQSARAMASYGVCVGILGVLRAEGIQVIEVTATEVKMALTGKDKATKRQMITSAVALYPQADWPRYTQNGKGYKKGEVTNDAEHAADAVAAIHAGVNTPLFLNILRVLNPNPGESHSDHHRRGRDQNGHSQLHPQPG
jgi:Holliday junction resolvasome RuvABC endonuclease subunit